MTTLQHSSANQNNRKSNRKPTKSYCNLNRKCGEIKFCTQMDKRVYTLNCLYCPQICLQLDIFINHMEQEHDVDLINSLQMDKEENELQMYDMQDDDISEDLQENENTTFSKEPEESNQFSFNDPLEDGTTTSALSFECSIKNEKIDYDTPNQSIVDDNMVNFICKTEIHVDDEEENKYPKTNRYQFGENLRPQDNSNRTQCCKVWKMLCDAKFKQLTESIKQLKSSVDELTANTVNTAQRNVAIMETLNSQKDLLGNDKIEANIRKIFPIQTTNELEDCNAKINDTNRAAYTRCISFLLKGQLHKSLTEIFSVNLIVASNIDGIHGKVALKSFKRLYDILMDSIRANGEENPEKEIRHAFKLVKKRHFQAMCLNKKKESSLINN